MRLCVLILLGTTAAAFSQSDRNASFKPLRDEARANKLLWQAANDLKAHRYDAALNKADEAVTLIPGDTVALNARGAALVELRRYDEAEQALKAAASASPDAFPPQYNLGDVLAMQQKYADAAAQFAGMKARFGSMPILKYKLFLSYMMAGEKEKADAALDEIRYPADGPAWYYAHAAKKLIDGKKAEAMRLIRVVHAIHEEDDMQIYDDTLGDTGLLK